MSELRVRPTFGHAASSLEVVRASLGLPRPVALTQVAASYTQEKLFSEPLVTGSGVALGGHQNLLVRRDGSYRFWGHFRATGWPSYDVSVVTTLGYPITLPNGARGGAQIAFAAQGDVEGTGTIGGNREHSWHQSGQSDLLRTEWQGVRQGTLSHDLQYDTNWFGSFGGIISFLGQVVAFGTVFGAAGVAIVVAGEAADLLNLEQLVLPGLVGVIVAGAAGFVLGPTYMLPAFVIGAAVTAVTVKQRHMTDREKEEARKVFGDKLPEDRILLTNLVGLGERPFTLPTPGGAILVNLGKGYDDPVNYTGKGRDGTEGWNAPGQLFIHELTHAWQIANESFTPEYYCRAFSTSAGTQGGDMSAYDYGPPTTSWRDFNTESQGSVVDDWYAGNLGKGGQQLGFRPMRDDKPRNAGDPNDTEPNPYFRYIRDNIRAGIA